MSNANFENEVKIEIKKKNSKDVIETEVAETETAIPAKKKFFSFEKLSALIFYGVVFFMPIFALPLIVAPVVSGKAIVFYCGIFLTAIFFILSAIKKGRVKIPKSALLAVSVIITLVWLVSALFSENIGLSLFGKLYDMDTFILILTSFLSLFLGSIIFQSEKRAVVFYITLFCSASIVFLFQFLHIVFGINIIPFDIFPQKTSNLIGDWNDFSVFFGLIGILALAFLETTKLEKKIKFFLYIAVFMSLLALFASNFSYIWIVFSIFSLFVFVTTLNENHIVGLNILRRFIRTSFFVAVIVLFFFLFKSPIGSLNNKLGLSFSEVRPSWQTTVTIAKQSLENNVVLGTGPNTFLYNWLKFKPADINNTVFWNARFLSGNSFLFSSLSTAGILGAIFIVAMIILLFIQSKNIFHFKQSSSGNSITVISFFGATYLWTHVVLYSSNILIFAMAFILTGILLALMTKDKIISVISVDLSRKTKRSFVFTVVAIVFFVGSSYTVYFFVQKFLAFNHYTNSLIVFEKTGNIEKTKEKLTKAIKMDEQDDYYRALSELSLVALGQVLTDKDLSEDKAVPLFRQWFDLATSSAERAVKINAKDPINWNQLGRVYESFIPLKVDGADKAALNAYAESFKSSPMDPSPFVFSARVALQLNKLDEAKKYLQSALVLKPDMTDALFMLSQIEASAGNLKEAILKAEQSVLSSPNNSATLFQLGLLNYQNKSFNNAKLALESAVAINSEFANARYFLGLVYDKLGEKSKAIEQFKIIQKTNPDNQEINKILSNLENGKSALIEVSASLPEKRSEPPVLEKSQTEIKSVKKK